jgi:hypothetical protein
MPAARRLLCMGLFSIFLSNGHGSQAERGLFLLQAEEMVDAQGIEPWTSPV